MQFTELTTKVLLDVFECLDLIDSINLAGTCVRLRDVAQLHYRRFKVFHLDNFLRDREQVKRHNRIDARTVLKRIGAYISVLVADLDGNIITYGLDEPIRKYCVNVTSLKIMDEYEFSNSYAVYTEWLKNLKLDKVTLTAKDLLLLDLSKTTTLKELDIYRCHYDEQVPNRLKDVLERNCNISSLRIPFMVGFDYAILKKFKNLKCFGLSIGVNVLATVSDNLIMASLEKLAITFFDTDAEPIVAFNSFLTKLAQSASNLTDLSIYMFSDIFVLDEYPLPALLLFKLTSLRLNVVYPNLCKELPQMQPKLKHLDLLIYDFDSTDYAEVSLNSTQQIISLIKKLEFLEFFHIKMYYEYSASVLLDHLRNELVFRDIFDGCSTIGPTLRLYVKYNDEYRYDRINQYDILRVKLDFNERKYTLTDIPFKRNYCSDSVEHQLLLPCCY